MCDHKVLGKVISISDDQITEHFTNHLTGHSFGMLLIDRYQI